MIKRCTKCEEEKEKEEFYTKGGNTCKKCRRTIMRDYRLNKRTEEEERKKPFNEVVTDLTEIKNSLDGALIDIVDRLDTICIGQKDIQIKQRELELKLDKKANNIT